MVGNGDYEVEVDGVRNRLFLTLDGMLDGETAGEAMDVMLERAENLDSGFDMVNDISSYKPMSQDATDELERGKQGLSALGMSAVVRVTGDSVVGKMQFERVVSDTSFHVATAETPEQAEEFLDEFRRENA